MGILVDARRFGNAFKHARKINRVPVAVAARRMGITIDQLSRIESGKIEINDDLLKSLLYHGIHARCMGTKRGHK